MRVPDLCLQANRLLNVGERHKVQLIRIQPVCIHIFITSENYLICLRAYLCHKHRISKRNPESFALSDRIMCNSLVPP